METQLIKEINSVLKNFPDFWEGETLLRSKVVDAINSKEPQLIKALVKNDKIKQNYSTTIDDIVIFDFEKLTSLLRFKEYWADSFTKYRNKIGLTSNGKYLDYNSDVVLDFPFKDCVLEGGMTREEQGKNEVYYNEIIARDEIDRLFSPKLFTNSKRYSKDGAEENITAFNDDDNLIIKGNNLIALHSLKQRFAGKVKLIYIDPPYNTGNDGFKYNDRFNRSTWLTFMKNRLEVARELLSDDGVIFVQIDNRQQAHLKILLDDIFQRENFIETITVVNNPRGRDYGGIANMHEYIHIYSLSQNYNMYKIKIHTEDHKKYSDHIGKYEIRELRNRNIAFHKGNRPNLCYPFYINPYKQLDNGFFEISLEKRDGFTIELLPAISQNVQTVWRWGKDKAMSNLNINIVAKKMKEEGRYMIVEKYRDDTQLARSVWWDKEVNSERGTVHLRELFHGKVFAFPKPESLLKRILEIATKENDIVLDFHLGSGTTAAVAHKMGRRYIGIEQMDYIDDITVPRLQKVIDGEQGGISKDVAWQGGGSFVYTELKQLNAVFIEAIDAASGYDELVKLFDTMKLQAHLNYQVELDKLLTKDYELDGIDHMLSFKDLKIDQQKQLLKELLDKNQLYINASEMDDASLEISLSDKSFTKSFYGEA